MKILNEKIKNIKKRKNAPLSINEWMSFFFVPLNPSTRMLPTKAFNEYEEDRFIKFGFEKKLRQSGIARILGIIFYIIILGTLIVLF